MSQHPHVRFLPAAGLPRPSLTRSAQVGLAAALILLVVLPVPAAASARPAAGAPPEAASLKAAAPRPAIVSAVSTGAAVQLAAEREDGLTLAWRPGAASGPEAVRLALPPGATVVLEAGPTTGPLAPFPAPVRHGWYRRVPFVEIHFDAADLGQGGRRAGQWRVEVRFVVAATAPAADPTAGPTAGPTAAPTGAPRTDQARPPAGPHALAAEPATEPVPAHPVRPVTVPVATGPVPGAGSLPPGPLAHLFVNPGQAERIANATAAQRAAWPAAAAPAPRGSLPVQAWSPQAESAVGEDRTVDPAADALRRRSLAGGRVKILVDADGIYRITGAQLAALGVDLTAVPVADLRLSSRRGADWAEEVALHVADLDADGFLGPDDWLEFWGAAMDDVFPGFFQGAWFTDVNAYWLDALPGERLRMAARDGAIDGGLPAAADFLERLRFEENNVFLGNHRTGLFDVDHFYWCPSIIWSAPGPAALRVESVALPGLQSGSARSAAVRVRLLSRTSAPDEVVGDRSQVEIGGEVISDVEGNGYRVVDHEAAALPASRLSPLTAVTLRAPGVDGVPVNRFELDFIEVDYPRRFEAVGGRLDFRLEPDRNVTVTGLAGADVVVLDVSDERRPVRLAGLAPAGGSVGFSVRDADPATGEHRRIAVASQPPGPPVLEPRALLFVPDSGLREPDLRVDLLVIGPREWVAPPLPALQRYVAHREAEGLRVLLVSTETMIDEFHDGLFSPYALYWMLHHAVREWARPPRHALLLGDATVDHANLLGGRNLAPGDCAPFPDPCGYDELAWVQHVPTALVDVPDDTRFLGYHATDAALSIVLPGGLPAVNLGRLPARTGPEVEALLDKVIAYEQAGPNPAWGARTLLVADRIREPAEEEMEAAQEAAAAAHLLPPYAADRHYYEAHRSGGGTAAEFTQDLLSSWSSPGAAVVSFVGHGSAFRWSGEDLLTNRMIAPTCRNDVELLADPGVPPPVVLNVNCITGAFMHLLGPSLLEELVRAPTGGAIAAYGPTGLADLAVGRTFLDRFLGATQGRFGRGLRLGDVVLATQAHLPSDDLWGNVLLGDPALNLAIPFGPAALALRASGAGGVVSLDWDAVPGADLYALYKSESGPSGPWTLLADGLPGHEHEDADVTFGALLHYSLEPWAGGWPGRWSAPVAVRPCDPEPPLPPGPVAIDDAQCDGSLFLSWSPSPTPSLAGYRVRALPASDPAGPPEQEQFTSGTWMPLSGLVPFREYVFQVTAVDWCDGEDTPSEVPGGVTCPIAMDWPAMVDDLRLARAGDDLLLSWTPVSATLLGTPLSPVGHAVFRADHPDFLADAGARVALVDGGEHVDAGRAAPGCGGCPAVEFYAVAALAAADGPRGAVSLDFPQGVRFPWRQVDGGDYLLYWNPVVHDIRARRTAIAAYDVYAAGAPLNREAVESMVPAARVPAPPARVPASLGDFHFVVAEDVHGNRSPY